MSAVAFSVRRRDLIWTVALAVLLSTIWIARSDIADAGGSPPGEGIAVVYVTSGVGFPDALGVGPGGGANNAPIVLVPPTGALDADTSAELIRLDPRTVIIVGGTSSVSDATMTALQVLLPNATVSRISGTNRYKTNAAFSAATYPIEGWASISGVAFGGDNPPTDSVVAGVDGAYNGTDASLWASIQLPHGAEILELETNVYDISVSDNIGALLYRVNNAGDVMSVASAFNSGFSSGNQTISTTTITAGSEIVDNGTYTYAVFVVVADGSPILFNVRVRYRLGASTG